MMMRICFEEVSTKLKERVLPHRHHLLHRRVNLPRARFFVHRFGIFEQHVPVLVLVLFFFFFFFSSWKSHAAFQHVRIVLASSRFLLQSFLLEPFCPSSLHLLRSVLAVECTSRRESFRLSSHSSNLSPQNPWLKNTSLRVHYHDRRESYRARFFLYASICQYSYF